MKTRLLIIPLILFLCTQGFVSNAEALSCAMPVLGVVYDKADYVFHGKVLDKKYFNWNSNLPTVTFQVLESFKENPNEQISVIVNENWEYKYEVGFEYVGFVYKEGSSLLIDPCWPSFQAFPSSIEIMRQLTIPDSKMHSTPASIFYESLTDKELIQFEENKDIIQEMNMKRLNSGERFHGQIIVITSLVLIPVAGAIGFVVWKKRK